MVTYNPAALAAELRRRSEDAEGQEREELLFLADEYDCMAALTETQDRTAWRAVALPN
jgi:hypothetical protein